MRPAGDTHLALLQAAQAIRSERSDSGQGATLQELVHRSQVGYKVARALVAKMKARGQLVKVGERQVEYRNRKVDEYAPAAQAPDLASGPGWVALDGCVQGWMR